MSLNFEVFDLDFPAGSPNKSATLVTGPTGALLVDAGFTRADGHRLVAAILDSGKDLTTVFVSHADPDYYFGLEAVADAFPDVAIVAHSDRDRAHSRLLRREAQGVGHAGGEPANAPGPDHPAR